jgi:soluble lytic murein transglycosylase-like protein
MNLTRLTSALAIAGTLAVAAPAQANVPHTVAPGETLWSIAAANGFTTRALAAANGLSENSSVVLGSTIQIPTVAEAAAALQGGGAADDAGESGSATAAAPSGAVAPPPAGSYVVHYGDSLSGIAARAGVSVGQLAWMNGLNPAGLLRAGTVLKLPSETAGATAASAPGAAPVQRIVPAAAPSATPGHVSSSQIGQVAAQTGVSASLAKAIAWQESGFNNGAVSSANARGVMQIMPGTWTWINHSLASRALDPNSALDNVQAGTLYLRQLLHDTGGDPAATAAAYYQGLASVRQHGMLPETQRYVSNVLSLRARFGGP